MGNDEEGREGNRGGEKGKMGEKKERRRRGGGVVPMIKRYGLSNDENEVRKKWLMVGWGKEEGEEGDRRGFLSYLPRGEMQGGGYRCTVCTEVMWRRMWWRVRIGEVQKS